MKTISKKYVLLCCICGGLTLTLGILYLVSGVGLGQEALETFCTRNTILNPAEAKIIKMVDFDN